MGLRVYDPVDPIAIGGFEFDRFPRFLVCRRSCRFQELRRSAKLVGAGTLVANDGTVCGVAFSGKSYTQWL
jgi:hypothetical protein